jgi:hypothetical protein
VQLENWNQSRNNSTAHIACISWFGCRRSWSFATSFSDLHTQVASWSLLLSYPAYCLRLSSSLFPLSGPLSHFLIIQVVEFLSLFLDGHISNPPEICSIYSRHTGNDRTVEPRVSGDMSTAVAEARPRYGFPGSGKGGSGGGGGGHGKEADMAAVGKRRSDGFFIEEVAEEEVLTDTSSVGAPSPSGSSIGENSSSEAGGDDVDEEVESKLKEDDALDCLDALEDSLPVK